MSLNNGNIISESPIDMTRLPRHVAIIMDGNGRWAKKRDRERTEGHHHGVESVINITRAASDMGIGYLTLYGFSTENWNRPQAEVDILMSLIGLTVEHETPYLVANNVRLELIGEIERIPEESRRRLYAGVEATKHCTGLTLIMALSYSSRWEITRAAREIAAAAKRGEIDATKLSEHEFADYLATARYPDPDLLIRTGGETRISNFLLWQCAYSEFYFTPVLWPDFDKKEFDKAIAAYQNRERRFGQTSQQIADKQDNITTR